MKSTAFCRPCGRSFDPLYRYAFCPHAWKYNDPAVPVGAPRRGDWIQTWTGRKVFIEDPRPEDIDVRDIAQALGRICRFGGHVNCDHYSVAQHSYLVSYHVATENALVGLLHDAAEAYLGDIVRPLKRSNAFGPYREIEKRWENIIDLAFDLEGALIDMSNDVKRADRVLLSTERRDVLPPGPQNELWDVEETPLAAHIVPWSARQSTEMFLGRFAELTARRATEGTTP